MQEYEISNSLEWQDVRTRLTNSRKTLSIFKNDIDRMLTAIDKEVSKLSNLEITVRAQKSRSSIAKAQEQLDLINQRIRSFNKHYMMALLTHG
jgi:peptidoglycan hydrolase CwlO-like protein